MADRVTVTQTDGLADVRLNRADKMNALDSQMFEAIISTGRALAADRSLRAVVLSGEGRAFCAGLDFGSFMGMASGGGEGLGRGLLERIPGEPANYAQSAAFVWARLPVPVIAAVHGVAFGGGLQIALGADVRFVTPTCQLSVMEIKWGLIPDMGGSQTLRHLVRLDVAKELTFTGRIVSGSEAVTLGLATHVSDDPYAAAMAMARDIATKSPNAVRAGKHLIAQAYEVGLAEGLQLEATLQLGLLGKPNQVEAVRANLEKRVPAFSDAD